MPNSSQYRYKRENIAWVDLDKTFMAVDNLWATDNDPDEIVVTEHIPTKEYRWHYNLQFTYNIKIEGITESYKLKGNIHLFKIARRIRATEGHYWVEGIKDYDAFVPAALIKRYDNQTDAAIRLQIR